MIKPCLFSSLAVLVCATASCGSDFTPPSNIESVRVLATRADQPYAAPGDTVNLEMLAFDGRASQPEPMEIFWIPTPCIDPAGDAYYSCYSAFRDVFEPGVDLTPKLQRGATFSFQMPADVIDTHRTSRAGDPYGVAVAFGAACAGHLEYVLPAQGASAAALPFGCFDSNHVALGADDFVFSYAVVYAFTDRVNTNPSIEALTFAGNPVDPASGFVVPHCTSSKIEKCPSNSLDVVVPDADQEIDPSGSDLKEQVWVSYYVTGGKVDHDEMILFDATKGRITDKPNTLYNPQAAGDYLLWAVLHDNRGGVNWLQVPFHAD